MTKKTPKSHPVFLIDGIQFTPKGKKIHRSLCESGATWTWANADLKAADGTVFDAVLLFCESDGGEHWETLILLDTGDLARQGDPDFFQKINKDKSTFFPYRFRTRKPLAYDHHPKDAKGWRK